MFVWVMLAVAGIATNLASAQDKSQDNKSQNNQVQPKRENFTVAGHKAFVIIPSNAPTDRPIPWVWYAPTLGRGLPGGAEKWMFERFHRFGIAVAGIDVGESYGSPAGRALYQKLYEQLTTKRRFHRRPVLHARSRGGLMLYNWAVEHPDSVAGVVGIYPVCNIASYPGVKRAAPAFKMTAEQLQAKLTEHNPIDRLAPLAKAKVPIFHIHGDSDKIVPLDLNSAELAKRYTALGGPVEVEVVKGQGHNMWKGWFESQKLTDFAIAKALGRPGAAVAVLTEKLKDKDRSVQYLAAGALGYVGPEAVPVLITVLNHKDKNLRRIAAMSLSKTGAAAKDAVPALTEALKDPDKAVREAARMSLDKIQAKQ